MKMKKLISLTLATALAISLLVGCSKDTKNNEANAATQQATTQDEKPVDIIWYIYGTQAQRGDVDSVLAKVNPELQKKIGVNLVLKPVDNAAYEEKMNMVINSNEYYDLCWTSNWRNKFEPNVAKGAFKEITTDMLNKNAPDMVKLYPKEYFDFGRINGKLYGIWSVQSAATGNVGANVQVAIAKKYNFDVNTPKTLDEFTTFFEQIAKNEKGLYATRPATDAVYMFGSKIECIGDFAYYKMDDPAFKVYQIAGSDFEKKTQELNQSWFKKGIIRQDQAVVVNGSDLPDRNANKYVADEVGATGAPGGDATWSARQKLEYKTVLLKGYDNTSFIRYSAGSATLTAISTNSKYPEKALKLINLLHSDKEIYNTLIYGVEGKHYTKVDANTVAPIENSGYGMQQLSYLFGNYYNNYLLKGSDPAIVQQQKTFDEKAVKSPISGFSFNSEPVKNEISQLNAVKKEFESYEYLPNYEAKHQERMTKLKNAGIDKVVAEIQKQLDDWAKVNNKKK